MLRISGIVSPPIDGIVSPPINDIVREPNYRLISQSNDATEGHALTPNQTQNTPAAVPAVTSAALVAAAASAAHSLTGAEAMAAATLMNFATDPGSLVAAFLQREEARAAGADDVAMQTDEPAVAQPITTPSVASVTTAIEEPRTALAFAPAERQNNATAALLIAPKAPARPLHKAVERCSDAVNLIRNNGGLPLNSTVAIRIVTDEGLTSLAEALKSVQHPLIRLVLDRRGYTFTATGLKQIGQLPLSALTIDKAEFYPEDFSALANAQYPIDLALAMPKRYTQIVPNHGPNTVVERTPYLQSAISLRTLRNLEIHDAEASDAEMEAIRTHPHLHTVTVFVPVDKLFFAILSNPRIVNLTMATSETPKITPSEGPWFPGLSAHPTLRSLAVNHVWTQRFLSELGSNAKINKLQLCITADVTFAVRHLANMPALSQLKLRAVGPNASLRQADIRALCKKPLQFLGIQGFTMDAATISAAVQARADDLILWPENAVLSSGHISTLCANKKISRLVLGGNISLADAARLAASPTLTSLRLGLLPSSFMIATIDIAKQIWASTGKPLSSLHVGPMGSHKEQWMMA